MMADIAVSSWAMRSMTGVGKAYRSRVEPSWFLTERASRFFTTISRNFGTVGVTVTTAGLVVVATGCVVVAKGVVVVPVSVLVAVEEAVVGAGAVGAGGT